MEQHADFCCLKIVEGQFFHFQSYFPTVAHQKFGIRTHYPTINPPIDLYLIFEIYILNWIFEGCTGSKNQVRTRLFVKLNLSNQRVQKSNADQQGECNMLILQCGVLTYIYRHLIWLGHLINLFWPDGSDFHLQSLSGPSSQKVKCFLRGRQNKNITCLNLNSLDVILFQMKCKILKIKSINLCTGPFSLSIYIEVQ